MRHHIRHNHRRYPRERIDLMPSRSDRQRANTTVLLTGLALIMTALCGLLWAVTHLWPPPGWMPGAAW